MDIIMTVYNWLKTKRPKSNIIKQRSEGDLETVYGPTLEICYLNRTASRIMKLSDGKNTVDDIKRKLLACYDVDEKELEDDNVDIIRNMQWKRLMILEG